MKKYIALTVFLALSAFGYAQSDSAANYPFLTSPGYEKMRAETLKANLPKVLVVMASFEGCGPCKVAKRDFLPRIAEAIKPYDKVELYILDVEEDNKADSTGKYLGEKWNLTNFPSFLVVDVLSDAVKYNKAGYSDLKSKQEELFKEIMDAVRK